MHDGDRLRSGPQGVAVASAPRPAFAHESEAEFTRILDFYAVAWEYEPHTFPILWNLDGAVLESFAPDFFLPDLDLYVELTTLRQRLVRKKNRKLRRLRELYPAIRIKLFYARDFRALMLKYGKLALADALSGTVGQVAPAQPHGTVGEARDESGGSTVEPGPGPSSRPGESIRAVPGTARRGHRGRHGARTRTIAVDAPSDEGARA